jgi:hypothetical protein
MTVGNVHAARLSRDQPRERRDALAQTGNTVSGSNAASGPMCTSGISIITL